MYSRKIWCHMSDAVGSPPISAATVRGSSRWGQTQAVLVPLQVDTDFHLRTYLEETCSTNEQVHPRNAKALLPLGMTLVQQGMGASGKISIIQMDTFSDILSHSDVLGTRAPTAYTVQIWCWVLMLAFSPSLFCPWLFFGITSQMNDLCPSLVSGSASGRTLHRALGLQRGGHCMYLLRKFRGWSGIVGKW